MSKKGHLIRSHWLSSTCEVGSKIPSSDDLGVPNTCLPNVEGETGFGIFVLLDHGKTHQEKEEPNDAF